MDLDERVERLAKVALFQGLTRPALELIARVANEESHGLGTLIFQHGQAGDKLYMILDGRIRISRDVPGMGEEALAIALLCALTSEGRAPDQVAATLWRSVAHGGDSDSTGSLTGNLLGAMFGPESLPAKWCGELEMRDLIERIARDLWLASHDPSALDGAAYPP